MTTGNRQGRHRHGKTHARRDESSLTVDGDVASPPTATRCRAVFLAISLIASRRRGDKGIHYEIVRQYASRKRATPLTEKHLIEVGLPHRLSEDLR